MRVLASISTCGDSMTAGTSKLPRGDLATPSMTQAGTTLISCLGTPLARSPRMGGLDVTFSGLSAPLRSRHWRGWLHSHVRRLAFGPMRASARAPDPTSQRWLCPVTSSRTRHHDAQPARQVHHASSVAGTPLAASTFWIARLAISSIPTANSTRIVVATFGDLAWKSRRSSTLFGVGSSLYLTSSAGCKYRLARAGSYSSATYLPAYRCSATGRRSPLRELQRWRPRWRKPNGHDRLPRSIRRARSLSRRNKVRVAAGVASRAENRFGTRCAIAPVAALLRRP